MFGLILSVAKETELINVETLHSFPRLLDLNVNRFLKTLTESPVEIAVRLHESRFYELIINKEHHDKHPRTLKAQDPHN